MTLYEVNLDQDIDDDVPAIEFWERRWPSWLMQMLQMLHPSSYYVERGNNIQIVDFGNHFIAHNSRGYEVNFKPSFPREYLIAYITRNQGKYDVESFLEFCYDNETEYAT